MKKLLYLLSLCLLVSACDDGDVFNVELDFNRELSICELSPEAFFLYDTKKSPSESLSLIFPRNSNTELIFNPVVNNFETTFNINGTNSKFNYRTYDGSPENLICNLLPDATTNILKDYAATSGTVKTLTTFVDEDGRRKIKVKFLINNVNLEIISLTEVDFGTYNRSIKIESE